MQDLWNQTPALMVDSDCEILSESGQPLYKHCRIMITWMLFTDLLGKTFSPTCCLAHSLMLLYNTQKNETVCCRFVSIFSLSYLLNHLFIHKVKWYSIKNACISSYSLVRPSKTYKFFSSLPASFFGAAFLFFPVNCY